MATPTSYELTYDFTAFQSANPNTPLPADKLEIEFNNLQLTTDQLITNLGLIQRSDGKLTNKLVTFDALDDATKALLGTPINPRGDWAASTAYSPLDLVTVGDTTYICVTKHASGVSFTVDLTAGYWQLWANPGFVDGTSFFQSLSGDGSTTVFTVTDDLGTDEKGLMIFINNSGWIPQNPSAYTINGTSLTFGTAPPNASDNIFVFAPSKILSQAAAYATAAASSATGAASSASTASTAATAAQTAQTAAETAQTAAEAAQTAAETAQSAAETAETNAAASETAAASSASSASTSATAAASSASSASTSASSASTSASNASDSADLALTALTVSPLYLNVKNATQLGKSYAAVGDGTSHPLSEFYGSLAAAQADYPLVSSLTQEIDTVVIEYLINAQERFSFPAGTYLMDKKLTPSGKTWSCYFHPDAELLVTGSHDDYMIYGTNCTATFEGLNVDANQQVFVPIRFDSSNVHFEDTYIHDFGNQDAPATILGAGILLDDYKDVFVRNFKCRNGLATGDSTFGNGAGAIRFLALGNGVAGSNIGYADIDGLDFDAEGSDAEELDLFQANIDNGAGGVIKNMRLRYNGKTRRAAKFHSGNWKIYGLDIRKSSDFAVVSGSTGAGEKNLNCVDWSNNGDGSLHVIGGYVDASGFVTGLSNSGGTADVLFDGVRVKGSNLRVIRNNPETGSPQNVDHVGLYCVGSSGNGTSFVNCKIEGFTMGANIQGSYAKIENCVFDDPSEYAAYVGFSTNRKNIKFSNNKVITRTSGYLNNTRIIRVFDITNAEINGNILVQDGNTGHASIFIGFTDSDTTGYAIGNCAPMVDTNTVSVGSSTVISRLTNATDNPLNVFASDTDALQLPAGTTAQRPGSPGDGMIRFNSTLNQIEGYNGGWLPIAYATGTQLDVTDPRALGKTAAAQADGTSHPLSEFYGSLAAAQADYPNATALTQEIDQVVLDYIVYAELDGFCPAGTYMCNFTALQSAKTASLTGETGTIFKGNASPVIEAAMFQYGNCSINRSKIKYDCDNKFSMAVYFPSNTDSTEIDCEYVNGGLGAVAVTSFTAYLHFTGTDIKFRSYRQKCTDILATGNDGTAFGSSGGAARYNLIAPSSNATVDAAFHDYYWPAGNSNAREFDTFNQNTGIVYGGTRLYNGYQDHHENNRRDIKVHSGYVKMYNCVVAQSTSFTAASPVGGDPQSEVGVKNMEIVGFTGSGTSPGRIELYGCSVDARAAPTGVVNSGGSSAGGVFCDAGTYILGPTTKYSRAHPETGANQQGESICFRGASADIGSGIRHSTVKNGGDAVQINGKNQYCYNNEIDDPRNYGIRINITAITGTAQAGASSSITLASGASTTDDFYVGMLVYTTGGTGSGQLRYITDYDGATREATVSRAWATTPDNTTTYSIGLPGIRVSNNNCILRTSGLFLNTEMIRVQGAQGTEVMITGNKLLRIAADTSLTHFINPVSNISGVITGNICPDPRVTTVNISSTNTFAKIYDNGTIHVRADTTTAYTITQSDYKNKRTLSNASGITCTLPNDLPAGFECEVEQIGAGQVTFSAASGATLQNRSTHTKTAGQYGVVKLQVRTNSTGANAVWVLSGDTAA